MIIEVWRNPSLPNDIFILSLNSISKWVFCMTIKFFNIIIWFFRELLSLELRCNKYRPCDGRWDIYFFKRRCRPLIWNRFNDGVCGHGTKKSIIPWHGQRCHSERWPLRTIQSRKIGSLWRFRIQRLIFIILRSMDYSFNYSALCLLVCLWR